MTFKKSEKRARHRAAWNSATRSGTGSLKAYHYLPLHFSSAKKPQKTPLSDRNETTFSLKLIFVFSKGWIQSFFACLWFVVESK